MAKVKEGDRVEIQCYGPIYNGTKATVLYVDGYYVGVVFDVNGTEAELYSTEVIKIED